MSQITPFVKRMRTQGGTLYTFSSAVEDIGLNINERNNVVKMSHYALLDIPEVTAPIQIQQNKFNAYAIDGAFKNYEDSGNIKDGRVVIAESFQNYALNLETYLLSQENYNQSLQKTVSERVFWKWMKETGAVRWTKDASNPGYWIEEIDTDSSLGYNSVVKYVGEISAGSIRTDTFGTYNETYILVPTSHGQTSVYFKQDYDENYQPNLELGPNTVNIKGRESYTLPHPDGLSFLAQYDVTDSSTLAGSYSLSVDASDGAGYQPGWWYTAQGKEYGNNYNYYLTDSSTILDSSIYNYNLKYTGATSFEFKRSNVDALGIEYDLGALREMPIWGPDRNEKDSTLTYDKMAIEYAVDDYFEFNAVLIYYTVYNKTMDKVLATNLLGVLFLDPASGNTSNFPDMEISIPAVQKYQSGPDGFGSSYAFRINIKSDNMVDDTQAVIYDMSTSSQAALENWTDVFANLEKSLQILNAHTGTINYITQQYTGIAEIQSQQSDTMTDLQYQINDINTDLTGTTDTIPLYTAGNDPFGDSSIYMRKGRVGVFTNNPDPSYNMEVDGDVKVNELYIENAIKDTSGNILLGYGSPLQLGSSTNQRGLRIYDGGVNPVMEIDGSGSLRIDVSTYFTNDAYFSGNLIIDSGAEIIGYLKESSLGDDFRFQNGLLEVIGGGAGGGDVAWANGNVGSNNQLITSAGDGSIVSESGLTWDGATFSVDGQIVVANGHDLELHATSGDPSNYGDIVFAKGDGSGEGARLWVEAPTQNLVYRNVVDGFATRTVYHSGNLSSTQVNNRLATFTGDITQPLEGDANLTFDGTTLSLPSGSVSVPSISFTSDPNLGLYRYTTDQLGVAGSLVLNNIIGAGGNTLFIKGEEDATGGGISILAGDSNNNNGAGITIEAGAATGSFGWNGGTVNIIGGWAEVDEDNGGDVDITGGYTLGDNGDFGGNVNITGGNALDGTGTGGSISINGGNGGDTNGSVKIGNITPLPTTGTGNYLAITASGILFEAGAVPSDIRLKDLNEEITGVDSLNKLNTLNAYKWSYNDLSDEFLIDVDHDQIHYGLIAQEVQEVFPEIVKTNTGENGEEYLGLDYIKLIPVLTASIKELKSTIDKQQAQIDQLLKLNNIE